MFDFFSLMRLERRRTLFEKYSQEGKMFVERSVHNIICYDDVTIWR